MGLSTRFILRTVLILLASTSAAYSQTGAAIAGVVKDSAGAPIPAARVVATSETGVHLEVLADGRGEYRIRGLQVGTYSIEVAQAGYNGFLRSGVAVLALQTSTVDVVLASTSDTAAAASPNKTNPSQTPSDESTKIEPVHEEVTITARRVEEEAQSVPIPVSVVSSQMVDRAGAFNVNRLKELIPTVQFYSSNPRNSAINIRGLGSPFGLTNDGIEPGVGFYVDGVFYARTAAATLDFLDLERIEVLRGPQGTLFGKNTTAGAISITTRRPSLTPEVNFEISYGNLGFLQAKGSVSGPLGSKWAGRLSFSGTQRDGMMYNVATDDDVNDLNNQGVRAQLMYIPNSKVVVMFSGDYTRQRPEGYAQVVVGVAPTLRPANRQYAAIAADLGYAPPSMNPFDRLIDTDTAWRSNQNFGGSSVTVDWTLGRGQLTSITGWRVWDWNPSNDRDFIGLPVTTASAAPSKQRQWTQELRYAGDISSRMNYVAGVFFFAQNLKTAPFHKQEQGAQAARFLLAPGPAAETPGLLDGYGQNIKFDFDNISTAAFGQVEWDITSRWRLIPGLRYNYDNKTIDYDQQVYGGLQTTNAALIALQRSVLAPLQYATGVGNSNVSGQMTVAYKAGEQTNFYGTFATGFKSVGLNLGGVPSDAAGQPILSAATVRPESVRHFEVGVKSRPFARTTANLSVFDTSIRDFQTQVVNSQVGVLRGYLANAEKVRVRGIEFDGTARIRYGLNLYASAAFTDGRYVAFRDAPPALEDTGGSQVKDVSGSILPGISKWAVSYGGEHTRPASLVGVTGEFFTRLDASFRSRFSSSPSASRYMMVNSYNLLNARVGFRSLDGWTVSLWARNLANANYFEFLSAAPGNSGLIVGLPGDKRTYGITLSRTFSDRSSMAGAQGKSAMKKKFRATMDEFALRRESLRSLDQD